MSTTAGAGKISLALKQCRNIKQPLLLAIIALLPLYSTQAGGAPQDILVVYPKVREPYNQIFLSIIKGINNATGEKVRSYEVERNEAQDNLHKFVKNKNIKSLIGLGNRGIRAVYQLEKKEALAIVFGASAIKPKREPDFFALSLVPAPKELFRTLSRIQPEIDTVHVVFERDKQDSLIELARQSAESEGLRLLAYSAENVVQMAGLYRQVLTEINPKKDALWLAKTGKSIEKAIMNQILRDAWKKKFVVFSSNLADVKKGVLFSLYPDNEKMGEKLVELLTAIKNKELLSPEIFLSEQLNSGLNVRTAAHLGIHFNEGEKNRYSVIYPLK